MKASKLLSFSAVIILLLVSALGCNKNDSVLGPNGLNSQVSFTMAQQNGLNGGVEFLFRPSVDVKIFRMVSILPSQNFTDTLINYNSNYVFSKDTLYILEEYTGVENGQQWKFSFTGSIPGQNNSNYNATADYTVQ